MTSAILLLWQLAAAPQPQGSAASAAPEQRLSELIQSIGASGRVLQIGEDGRNLEDPRTQIAPGAPPLLAFRYFYGADRHRFGKMDLMLDDAGH